MIQPGGQRDGGDIENMVHRRQRIYWVVGQISCLWDTKNSFCLQLQEWNISTQIILSKDTKKKFVFYALSFSWVRGVIWSSYQSNVDTRKYLPRPFLMYSTAV